jgi:hypothetical protein
MKSLVRKAGMQLPEGTLFSGLRSPIDDHPELIVAEHVS